MKNLIYSLFTVGFFFSCKSSSTTRSNDSTVVVQPNANDSKELIKKFKPIIQGVWVKKDYIEKVNATKSPLAAANLAKGITTMYIDTKKIVGDSLTFLAGYDNHEGGELTFKFKNKAMWTDLHAINYTILGKDTILDLYNTDSNTSMKIEYVKALNNQSGDLGYGMNFLINKALIVGKYRLSNSGASQEIIFEPHGKVKGLANFSSYYIDIDFNIEPMTNLDEIGFDIMTKHRVRYTFKINKDTLNMYDTHPNADSTKLIIGDLKYQLIRAK